MSTMRPSRRVSFVVALTVVSLGAQVTWAATLYVYPDGHGSYATIQAAINAAVTGDIVMLASGTYTGAGNRDITYSGKAITVRSQTGNPADCIIDCQSLGRGFTFVNNETATSVLRGITVANGLAPGSSTAKIGGGIRCGQSLIVKYGSPTITDCIIRDCSAFYGGGMGCTNGSTPVLTNCVFSDNDVSGIGTPAGGGLYCLESNVVLSHCRFTNNTSRNGGGLYCETCLPDLDYCEFGGNQATLDGAGICANNAKPALDYCTFYANAATSWGGGLYIYGNGANSALTNCTLYGNSAATGGFGGGAGVACDGYAHPTLTRCIIANSPAGDAVNCGGTGVVTVTCCDIYGNAGGAGCVAGQIGSNNNIALNPYFCHPALADFTVRDVSPCVPANSPCGQQIGAWGVGCSGSMTYTVCPTGAADFTTIQAAIDAAVNSDTIQLCDATFTGAGNRDLDYGGRAITVRSASNNPQACIIDCAADPNQPHRGFYFHSGEGSSSVLQGVTVTRGYAASDVSDYGGGAIRCDSSSPTLTNCIFTNNTAVESGGAVGCFLQSAPALTNCAFSSNACGLPGGGGLASKDSNPTLNLCTFLQNQSTSYGGGACVAGSSNVNLTNCTFTENTATDDGGGLANFAQATLTDCEFTGNQTAAHGGGLTCVGASATLLRCRFTNNTALNPQWGVGGGISVFGFNGQVQYCTFSGNTAGLEGGGVYAGNNSHPTLDHCTFFANGAPAGGGVALCWPDYPSFAVLQNTIIAASTQGQAVYCDPNCGAALTCCDIIGNAGGDYVGCIAGQSGVSGNFSLPPIFCDAPNGDFTVRDDSPCAPANSPPACGQIGAWPVGCQAVCRGDCNCDGVISFADINPFVQAVGNLAAWQAAHPGCPWQNCDINQDGVVSFADINPFVAKLGSPGPCP